MPNEPHEREILRDSPPYTTDDEALARRIPWHDKAILCEMLEQDCIKIQPGNWWIKPSVSEYGLGLGSFRCSSETGLIIQPEAMGKYVNVDAVRLGGVDRLWIYGAKRRGIFFDWFRYDGHSQHRLTPAQRSKVRRLLSTVNEGFGINVEFIGDYAIEAHGRISIELAELPLWAGDSDPIEVVCGASRMVVEPYAGCSLYSFPVWGGLPPSVNTGFAHLVSVRDLTGSDEPTVHGLRRVAIVNVAIPRGESDDMAGQIADSLRGPDAF